MSFCLESFASKEISLEYIDKQGYTAMLSKEAGVTQGIIGTSHTDPTYTGLSIETSWPAVLVSVTIKALEEFLRTTEIEFSGKRVDRRDTRAARGGNRMRRRTDTLVPA
jgi:hypothetical protein